MIARTTLRAATVIAVLLAFEAAYSCGPDNRSTVSFRCHPRNRPADERCPDTHFCCSDDPATADGALPAYADKSIDGSPPLFADAANDASDSGLCVDRHDIPAGSGLLAPQALNCPVPCNPTWSRDDVAAVCGTGRVCCQTVEVHPDDCVRDGETGRMRPADGRDALASLDGGTNWRPTRRSTHQDRDFDVCAARAGDRVGPAFRACVSQLTTANQRGDCMALGPDQRCPTDPTTGYRDVCAAMGD